MRLKKKESVYQVVIKPLGVGSIVLGVLVAIFWGLGVLIQAFPSVVEKVMVVIMCLGGGFAGLYLAWTIGDTVVNSKDWE